MTTLAPEAQRTLAEVAQRHGVSLDAAQAVLHALAASGGGMAQFNHPDLGGMGQWSRSGMIMVGDMFNHGLKARVDALCTELAGKLPSFGTVSAAPPQSQSQYQGPSGAHSSGFGASGSWWPADLGAPASSGGQNDLRYAYFPATRRLALMRQGQVELYDTGDHQIGGVSQQQGGAGENLPVFSSDKGQVRLTDLRRVGEGGQPAPTAAEPARAAESGDPLATIERLAELRQKGVLSEEEFAAKKAELLSRL